MQILTAVCTRSGFGLLPCHCGAYYGCDDWTWMLWTDKEQEISQSINKRAMEISASLEVI